MFNTIEQAIKGSPTEFYHFSRGSLDWYLTSADKLQSYGGNDYAPTKLKRSKIKFGAGLSAESVTITVPRNNEIAADFIVFPPSLKTTVVIYARHRNDTDNETVQLWKGRVKNAKFSGAVCELYCESFLTSERAQGLRRTFGANCSHVLYDQTPLTCLVNKASFEVSATLDSVSGATISDPVFDGYADGYFNGGIVEWINADGDTEYRMILQHTGANLRLVSAFVGIAASDAVKVYPGCNRTKAMCADRFSNLVNFGGWPYMPTESPFAGTMIY